MFLFHHFIGCYFSFLKSCKEPFGISVDLCLVILAFAPISICAQKAQLPLNEGLKASSEKMKVRLGASYLGSTFKIKIGDYTMNRAKVRNDYSGKEKGSGPGVDNSYASSFSTVLISPSKDTVFIEVDETVKKKEIYERQLFDFFTVREYELIEDSYAAAIFLKTNRDIDDQWVLLLSRNAGNRFSAQETILTNGEDQIKFKYLQSESNTSMWKSPAEGIELYFNDISIGALQYKSIGMGYKQYVWVLNETSIQQKNIIIGAMAAITQLLQGAQFYTFEE